MLEEEQLAGRWLVICMVLVLWLEPEPTLSLKNHLVPHVRLRQVRSNISVQANDMSVVLHHVSIGTVLKYI